MADTASNGEGPPRRPNVLFIITDQHRADHVGFGGNRVVRTPRLDSLAERGMVFDNAWVANPICMPNRSTLLTGRLPTAHGVIFNDRSLDLGANTHARRFRDAGYRPVLDDPSAAVRDHVLIEDDLPRALAKQRRAAPKARTLVTDQYKLTRIGAEEQLFDLSADGDELDPLGSRDPMLRAEMVDRLATAVIETADDARGTPVAG